jgi:fumarate reductase flavoprotein subunit
MARHFPSAAATGNAWYIGAEGSRGDALGLADQVDAQLIGHDRGLRLLHTGFAKIYEAYLPGWLVMVNQAGHRFCDETAPYGMMDFLVREQGDRVFALLDHAALEATTTGAARYKQLIPGAKNRSPHWNLDVIEQMVTEGRVVRGDALDEVATGLGLSGRAVAGAVRRYNDHVAQGVDADFAKDPKFLEPIATAPFYGVEMRPSTVCFTAYGLRIDRDARVLDVAGQVIPGLFAAGECTGGVVGAQYVGSGNSYANCTVFGRVAGTAAAALASLGI